jgi:hypothetical protein
LKVCIPFPSLVYIVEFGWAAYHIYAAFSQGFREMQGNASLRPHKDAPRAAVTVVRTWKQKNDAH